jgi:hypothetical protein
VSTEARLLAHVTPSCGGEKEAVLTPSSLEEEDTVTASAFNAPSLPRSLPPSLPRSLPPSLPPASAFSVLILVLGVSPHILLACVLVLTCLANPCEKAWLDGSSQTLAAKKSPQCLGTLERAPCDIARLIALPPPLYLRRTAMCARVHVCMCVCVCVYTRARAHTHTRSHARTHTHMHTYTHIHIHTQKYLFMYLYI